jgi:hypothetical protein
MLGLCATVVKHYFRCWISSTSSDSADDVIMLDANYISERLSNLKNEMSVLRGANSRNDRVVEIKLVGWSSQASQCLRENQLLQAPTTCPFSVMTKVIPDELPSELC